MPQDLSLWRRPACHTLSKALNISSARARVAPDLLKALPILSDTTVRRSAVDWEDQNHTGNHLTGKLFTNFKVLYKYISKFFTYFNVFQRYFFKDSEI